MTFHSEQHPALPLSLVAILLGLLQLALAAAFPGAAPLALTGGLLLVGAALTLSFRRSVRVAPEEGVVVTTRCLFLRLERRRPLSDFQGVCLSLEREPATEGEDRTRYRVDLQGEAPLRLPAGYAQLPAARREATALARLLGLPFDERGWLRRFNPPAGGLALTVS